MQKETISDAKLFNNCPEEWIKIMEHVRSLNYESRPNYKLIYDHLQETLIRFQVSYSDPWDWDLVVCFYRIYYFHQNCQNFLTDIPGANLFRRRFPTLFISSIVLIYYIKINHVIMLTVIICNSTLYF